MKCILFLATMELICAFSDRPAIILRNVQTLDSVGAGQGVSLIDGQYFVYGDREVGMMRVYHLTDTLQYLHKEYRFTVDGKDVINHPTGIAKHGPLPVFIGNSVRMNKEGTVWKALIYLVNWDGLMRTSTLDGNLFSTIEDDACVQGTRPEYVQYEGKWVVATADYGPKNNEVRFYDPGKLAEAKKTSEPGVLIGKFTCPPWVQNLRWIPEKKTLMLVQNRKEGRQWRFAFLDLEKSMKAGKAAIMAVSDIDRDDELEGFTLTGDLSKGIAVASSRKDNIGFMDLTWSED